MFCQCGCGQVTKMALNNNKQRGWIKGEHIEFVQGHNSRFAHPMQGRKQSPESIKKMVENHVYRFGENHPMFGKTHTEECRKRMSESRKGVPLSEEHRKNIGLSGRKPRPGAKGRLSPMKGRCHTEEAKRKNSDAHKGKRLSRETEFQKGIVPWIKGRNHSEETKKKMRGRNVSEESKKKMSMALSGRKLSVEHIRKALSRRTPTSLEMKFQRIIDKNGLPYKFVGDGSFMIGRKNPDFININGEKIAIEVYAQYYKLRHAKTVQEWQEERERVFKEYGWKVIFFDAMQVNEDNILKHLGEVL